MQISLHDYKGSVVLINFWATLVPALPERDTCIKRLRTGQDKDKGFVILGVDVSESRQAVETYATSKNITYPLLLDEEDQWMSRSTGALGLPMSVIIDREGRIFSQTHGPTD